MAKTMEQQEADWRAESDARSLAEAAAIQADAKRYAAAQKAAKRLLKDYEVQAADTEARVSALRQLANGKGNAAKKVAKKRAAED